MLMLTIIVTIISMVIINRFVMSYYINTGKFDNKINMFIGKCKKIKTRNILNCAKYNIALVVIIIVIGLIVTITSGLNLGVDFKGGSAITLKSEEKINIKEVKSELNNYTITEETKVNDNEYLLRINESLDSEEIKTVKSTFENLK